MLTLASSDPEQNLEPQGNQTTTKTDQHRALRAEPRIWSHPDRLQNPVSSHDHGPAAVPVVSHVTRHVTMETLQMRLDPQVMW